MIRFDIITVHPELLTSPFSHSIMKRAQEKGLLQLDIIDLRKFGIGKQKKVDDYQYGGGAGMVMMPEPLGECIDSLKSVREYDEIIFLSPDGEKLNQGIANSLSLNSNLILICGHYKGIDERIRQMYVTRELSIGDFVLSGGELPAAVLVDAVVRLIPGVLNDETSALFDSFQDQLLAPPVYTRPVNFQGMEVPEVLLSGHQAKIDEWRYEQALSRTKERRPDLLDSSNL
jgi:tRNA (guanine37-N1)-methyltransferase